MSAVANVAINVDSRGAVGKLREIQNRTSALDRATQGLTRSLAGLAAGFGATFALGKIISDVAKLDTNLRRLGTVGGDVQGLSKALDQVGKNVEGLAGKAELAAASYQALSAGFTDTAQNARVVEAATKAAVGGLVDVTSVVEVTTKTLNAYGMSGNEAVKVTDSISKAIEFGQVQWSDYTSQLGRVASVAAVAGVSLDEVNAFIAAATKNGATAEIAFTGLGATLSTLLQPTKDSQKAAKELGIAWNLSGLQAKGFDKLIEELGQKMGGNQEAAVKLLGSQEALRGAFAAASKGGSDYRAILEGLGGAAGKTESDFEKMKGSLENQIKALNTAFTALGTKLFEVFGPTLTDLITGTTTALTNAVDAFNALPEPVKKGTAELVKMIAQLLLVKKAIEGIIALRTAFVAAMVAKAGAIASTGTAAKTSASAFALYTANTKTLQAQAATATPVLRGLLGVLRSLALIGVITVGVDVIVKGIGTLMAANAELAKLRGEQAAGGAAASLAGATRETVLDRQKTARETLSAIEAERKRSRTPGARLQQVATGMLGVLAPMVGLPSQEEMASRPALLAARERKARDVLSIPIPAAAKPPKPPELPKTPIDISDTGDGKGTKAAAKVKETDAQRAAKIEEIRAIERDIFEARRAGNEVLVAQLEAFKTQTEIQQRGLGVEEETQLLLQNSERLNERLKELDDQRLEKLSKFLQGTTELIQAQTDVISNYQEETQLLELRAQKGEEFVQKFKDINRLIMEGGLSFSQAFSQIEARTAAMNALNKEADSFEKALQGAGDIIGNQLRSAIDGLIDGTADWNDILQSTLKQLGSFLIKFGLNALAGPAGSGGILSFLGFGTRADGGPVTGGSPYIVGERGPELFVPQQSGAVVNNDQLSAAMGRYRRSSGDAGAMTAGDATEAGTAGAAVMDKPIDVRYSVERINSVDYVTADQFQQGMRQAAQQGATRGEQQALKRLRMSRSTRKQVGL